MAEIGIVELFAIAEAIGIVAAFLVGFYYSRRQMKDLSLDIEAKILNDLDDKCIPWLRWQLTGQS